MTPSTATTGSTLGTMVSNPKRNERKTTKMTPNTVTKAVAKLLSCDITR